jgi:3-dehydroquinate synthase
MKTVRVELGERSYEVRIETGALHCLSTHLQSVPLPKRGVLVCNARVRKLYGNTLLTHLNESGWDIHPLEIPEGEKAKTLKVAEKIYHQMLDLKLHRHSLMIALGGGVTGDLAGYVAATYLRGIPWVQVPTTLLAAVDSSVGGKVAVNLKEGKNLIGCFYQPRLVVMDPECLKTLSAREFKCGMAEVIKYGFIWDRNFFQYLLDHSETIKNREYLETIIERSVQIKAEVVSKDEKELGIRAYLNFGHTFGHSIEKTWNYKTFTHGEAVAIGMKMACDYSKENGFFSQEEWEQAVCIFQKYGLKTSLPQNRLPEIFDNLAFDKKTNDEGLHFILIRKLGEVFKTKVDPSSMKNFILQNPRTGS